MITRFEATEDEMYDMERKLEKIYEDIKKYGGYDAEKFSHVVENGKHTIIIKWKDPRF